MARGAELKELTRVRLLGFLREPEAAFWVFLFPIVLAGVLGFAFRSAKVVPSEVGVMQAPGAAALVEVFESDESINVELFESEETASKQLRKGAIDVIVFPGEPETLRIDEARAEGTTGELRVSRAIARSRGMPEPDIEVEKVSEKGSRYIDFLFPGLLGMNLMGTGMWGIGFAIADIRRRKLLRRMLVTPMRKSSFFMSFILSRLCFLVLELVILMSFALWVLGVPFRGDVVSFLAVVLLGAACFAGMGILTASRTKTIEGASGLMNFIMMPMWLASGVFFSYERFPDAAHPVIKLLPLTALNDSLRAIMLDGDSLMNVLPEIGVMAAWCVVTFVVALKIFRWE